MPSGDSTTALAFTLHIPEPNPVQAPQAKPVWWSYSLYRGPRSQKPQLLYARTKEESERIAYYKFFEGGHRVLGFDLEWPCYVSESTRTRLQDRVSVITIASDDTVALFHIGAHEGRTPEDLIAPSLRKIIESPAILKAGVGILSADFRRLHKFFGLRPQGAVELSHLHNLVSSGGQALASCTTKVVALEKQVKAHLGLPLDKGNGRVRMSNWSRKVLSKEQRSYAANDAYAGFILYHSLEAKRLAMQPVPPRPLWHERYEWFEHVLGKGTNLLLQLDDEDDGSLRVMKAAHFFEGRVENVYTVDPQVVARRASSPEPPEPPDAQQSPGPIRTAGDRNLPATITGRRRRVAARAAASSQSVRGAVRKNSKTTKTLLMKLKDHREKIAKHRGWERYMVAQNAVLEEIAQKRPRTMPELLEIKGMGKKRRDTLGAVILNTVILHEQQENSNNKEGLSQTEDNKILISDLWGGNEQSSSSQQNVIAAEPSVGRPPHLHTGLTSMMQRTSLLQAGATQGEPIVLDDSDESSPLHAQSPPACPGVGRPVRHPAMLCNVRYLSPTPFEAVTDNYLQAPQLHGIYRWLTPQVSSNGQHV